MGRYFSKKIKLFRLLKNISLDSQDYQLAEQWQSLLQKFSNLSVVTGQINITTALTYLKKICETTIFQAKNVKSASIHILGALEAAGLTFDAVWIAGLHDTAWPLTSYPNPFLPLAVTQKNQAFFEKLHQQLLLASKNIILSYPETIKNTPVNASIFIKNNPLYNKPNDSVLKIAEIKKNNAPFQLELIQDDKGPMLNVTTAKHYGSQILKDQAACPFRSFIKHRLGTKRIELPQAGVSSLNKGTLVHLILEKLFEQLPDHNSLCTLEPKLLINTIKKIVSAVLNAHQNLTCYSSLDNTVFFIAEKKRLEKLILTWIQEYEIKRKPFSVAAREEEVSLQLGKLPMHLRIDRIDKISDNHYIIIDYKTGISPVTVDIYEDPQLALYVLAKKLLPVKEVAIAQIRTNDMRFKPVLSKYTEWENSLLDIAASYLKGLAAIRPRHGEETCRYCNLAAVCRIKENI